MREILYRGKRVDNGEWVEGTCCKHEQTGRTFLILVGIDNIGPIAYMQEVLPETVDEYTGARDKKNKRIFEDDLLKDDNGFVYRVVVENGAFCLVAITEFNIPYDTLPKDHDFDEFEGNLADNIVSIFALKWNNVGWHNSFKVIGNIHDNPELIQEK